MIACSETEHTIEEKNVPLLIKEYTIQDFEFKKDTLFYQGKKYSGILLSFFPNSKDTAESIAYFEGLKDGIYREWYTKHQLLEERFFSKGKKNGKQLAYWPDGTKRFEFTAIDNKYEGMLKEWDKKGLLTHLGNFKNGQEEGEQKMWYENGNIRSNYIIKNGRRYGLLGTKNCVNVTDSLIDFK